MSINTMWTEYDVTKSKIIISSDASFRLFDLFRSPVSRIDPSISPVVDLSLFLFYGGSEAASEELDKFLKYFLSSLAGILLLSQE